jgi:hypothetical protein
MVPGLKKPVRLRCSEQKPPFDARLEAVIFALD